MKKYQLYLGDCLEFMRGMEAGSVDAVVTDPPYGISYNPSGGNGNKWFRKNLPPIIGDNKEFDPSPFLFFDFVVLFGANNFCDKLPRTRGWVCWDKKPDLGSNDMSDGELIFTNSQKPMRMFRHRWSGVIRDSENGERVLHPTQKPILLMRWLIKNYTPEGATIFDPFMGSGTTGVACMQLGRRFIGCEIDPTYFAIAEKRIREAAAQGLLFGEGTVKEVAKQSELNL